MIKSTDLRIGNKVKVFGKIYTIKELGEFEAAMEETEGVFSYEDVQGVELTGELLIGCGFEPNENKSWYRKSFCEWMVGPDGLSNIVLGITSSPNGLPIHVGIEQQTDGGFTIQQAAEIQRQDNCYDDNAFILKYKSHASTTPIEYLHQLQNLFYFLSGGTELTINIEQVTP